MTLKNHLLKMLESEIWANRVLVETIEKAKTPDERTLFLFSHVFSSYSMWLSRVTGNQITVALFKKEHWKKARL